MISRIYFVLLLMAVFSVERSSAQQFCRTSDRQNFTSTKDLSSNAKVKWKYKTGGKVFSSPVLSGDVIFVGSDDKNLYAIDKNSGKEIWKFQTAGEVRSSVGVENNIVFFLSSNGIFYALDASNGKLKWSFKTNGEKFYDIWDYYLSSPCVYNGKVYFGCGDGFIYALDGETGKLEWKYLTGGIVHASPTIADNAVLIGSFDGVFYCLNLDGTLRWEFKTIGEMYFPVGEIQYHAAVTDTTVFFCSRDYNVYALNIHSGKGHWVYHEPGSWTSVPSLSGKRLIITMSDAHKVLGFGKSYGVKLYEKPLPLNVFSSATLNDSIAYITCVDGTIYKMDIVSGNLEMIFQTEMSKKNYGDIFDMKTGKIREDLIGKYKEDAGPLYEEFFKLGSIFSTTWIEDGALYFGSTDGYIYSLE